MKFLMIPVLAALLTVAIAQDEIDSRIKEVPVVNLPMELRQSNYTCCPRHPFNGSCVHCSWQMLLQWQNLPELAAWWKRHYKGGIDHDSFCSLLDKNGFTYCTTSGEADVAFLEWAIKTRRGCITGVGTNKRGEGPTHMVCLVHLDSERAGILDNNDIKQIHWYPRQKFLDWWKNSHSWATSPLYSPIAPLPFGG